MGNYSQQCETSRVVKEVLSFGSIKCVHNGEYIPHVMKNNLAQTGVIIFLLGMIFPLPSGLDMVAVNLKVVQLARTVVCSLTLVVWYWVAYKAALLCPHYLFT